MATDRQEVYVSTRNPTWAAEAEAAEPNQEVTGLAPKSN